VNVSVTHVVDEIVFEIQVGRDEEFKRDSLGIVPLVSQKKVWYAMLWLTWLSLDQTRA